MARYQTGGIFDLNLYLSPRVRKLVESEVLDYYRKYPAFSKKVVDGVRIGGNLDVMILWEDPEEEE